MLTRCVLSFRPRFLVLHRMGQATLFLVALSLLVGCGAKAPVDVASNQSAQNLLHIWAAYSLAGSQSQRPPQSREDLIPFLKKVAGDVDPASILRSPDDNEDYVIVWGVNFLEIAKARGNMNIVLAYEKRGKNGKRHVLKPQSQVLVLSDDEFRSSAFPVGHTPAP
jgi:hypothetical protein